jgi:hypothetical protein
MIITLSPELLCMDTMTELTYLSNHFFHPIDIEFGIGRRGRRNVDGMSPGPDRPPFRHCTTHASRVYRFRITTRHDPDCSSTRWKRRKDSRAI